MSYLVLDHTADFMVEVRAPNLPGLFAEAARALFDILTDTTLVEARGSVSVRLEAGSTEQLLVSWLSELIYLHEVEQWLFSRFEIESLDQGVLEAEAWGEKLDPSRHAIEREVKAVTYHRLGVRQEQDAYRTTVVFDL